MLEKRHTRAQINEVADPFLRGESTILTWKCGCLPPKYSAARLAIFGVLHYRRRLTPSNEVRKTTDFRALFKRHINLGQTMLAIRRPLCPGHRLPSSDSKSGTKAKAQLEIYHVLLRQLDGRLGSHDARSLTTVQTPT